jgi:hypothetical protein
VLAFSDSAVLGSSLLSVVSSVCADSHFVSILRVGGASRLAGTPVLDAGQSSLTLCASHAAGYTDCLGLWMPVFNTVA